MSVHLTLEPDGSYTIDVSEEDGPRFGISIDWDDLVVLGRRIQHERCRRDPRALVAPDNESESERGDDEDLPR